MKIHHLATVIVILFGFILLHTGTDGFTAFTAETARIHQLKELKPKFPDVTLEDSLGRTYPFLEAFEDRFVLITFFYTSCTTVCVELEQNMGQLYEAIPSEYVGEEIVFLSISFDSETDTPETLENYRKYFNSDGESWRMARITDQAQLDSLLKAFGVIVIPDGNGHFAHNSAFYLVGKDGRLIDVMNYKKVDEAAEQVIMTLSKDLEG